MKDHIEIAIAEMAAQLACLNFIPSYIVVSDHDYMTMKISGVNVDGMNGLPKIIPASRPLFNKKHKD